ncbi:30043_t:CDS:2, partial [Gigaspora margarita]
ISSSSQIQIDLIQELKALSFEPEDEKFNEYFKKLGTLSHVEKEAKFREFLVKMDQSNVSSGNIKSTHNNEYLMQFQINEYHEMEIVERVASFTKWHELEHILFESMTLLKTKNVKRHIGSFIKLIVNPISHQKIGSEQYQRAENAIILSDNSNEFVDGKSSFNKLIHLLFAASGDLNDTIISMNGLPLDFNQPVNISLTDKQSIKCLEIFSKVVQDSQMAKEYKVLANRDDIQTVVVMCKAIMLNQSDALKLNEKLNDKRFDRIYINNLGDESYVGIKSILTKFRLLLNANNLHATLITLFMNWLLSVPQSDQEEIMESILKDNSNKYNSKWKQKFNPNKVMGSISSLMFEISDEMNALYDHTQKFEKYMEMKDANKIAKNNHI